MKKNISLFGYQLYLELNKKTKSKISGSKKISVSKPYKLNFGPGRNWNKPDKSWLTIDIDPALGDVVVNFQSFDRLPFESESVSHVYGSHVFEHMNIFKTPIIFKEIHRVLQKGGTFRLILPDAEKSIREYINRNEDFKLFKRRKERAKKNQNINYTLFECMREDFLSPNGQVNLLGRDTLAHQNAWDFETISIHLMRAGFSEKNIKKSDFKKSLSPDFDFEGTYVSEANEDYRSLYVEVVK